MSSQNHSDSLVTLVQDDFEIVDVPMVDTANGHSIEKCRNINCQFSHATAESERKSGRGIEPLVAAMQTTTKQRETEGPIFHTMISSNPAEKHIIFEAFCTGLPLQTRRIMNCNTCKRFLRQYGDLCIVGDDGTVIPLMWQQSESTPEYYRKAVDNVLKLFNTKLVGDEFMPRRTLGTETCGGWNHMSVTLNGNPLSQSNVSMKSQDTETSYQMLARTIADNSPEVINRAHHLIHDRQLPHAHNHEAPITYLKNVITKLEQGKPANPISRQNLITREARAAFPGCLSSMRGGMVGYLMECINEGQPFETLRTNWKHKVDPLSYMRPQAEPSVGNIESAEKIFARMGYTQRDLERVYLTLDQVPRSAFLWEPGNPKIRPQNGNTPFSPSTAAEEPSRSIFGDLLSKAKAKAPASTYESAPVTNMSFRKFALSVLPTAASISLEIPHSDIQPYFFTTGKPGSKPLMGFHREGGHTASWYTWGHRGPASKASLKPGWTPVTSIISFPHMWDAFSSPGDGLDQSEVDSFKFKRHNIRYLFVLEGAKEKRTMGLGLFPSLVRGEFHAVRKTLEEYSNKGRVEQPSESNLQHVGGLAVVKDSDLEKVIGIKTKTGQLSRYRITLFE